MAAVQTLETGNTRQKENNKNLWVLAVWHCSRSFPVTWTFLFSVCKSFFVNTGWAKNGTM